MRFLLKLFIAQFILATIFDCDLQGLWSDAIGEAIRNCSLSLLGYEHLIVNSPKENCRQNDFQELNYGWSVLFSGQEILVGKKLSAKHERVL